LKKLEARMLELKFITAPGLDILCSCTFSPQLEEPFEVTLLPSPDPHEHDRMIEVTKYWESGDDTTASAGIKRKADEGGANQRQ
jgi:hypothetical protein